MSGPESYVERCVEAARSIDADVLASLHAGPRIGQGQDFAFHALGPIDVLGEEVHCGVKLSHDQNRRHGLTEARLTLELATVDLLLRHVPQLDNRVPRFMAAISIGGEMAGLLTEDASRGGEVEVEAQTSNYRLAHEIAETIRTARGISLEIGRTKHSTSFLVDGEERLLDFTPAPVIPDSEDDGTSRRNAKMAVKSGAVIVDIPSDSRLGQSLAAATL